MFPLFTRSSIHHLITKSSRGTQQECSRKLEDETENSPISGIDDDEGVELASSLSSRKNARNIFIPTATN